MKFLGFILTFSVAITTYANPNPLFQKTKENLESSIRFYQLENGLRILLLKRDKSPTVALYTKFLVGSVDESPEEAGMAHLLEHMLFKGTHRVGTKDWKKEKPIQEEIERVGSRLDSLRLFKATQERKGIVVSKSIETETKNLTSRLQTLQKEQEKYIIKSEDSFLYEKLGAEGFNAYTSNDVTNYMIQLPKNQIEAWARIESDRLLNPILREFYQERDVISEERKMRTENTGMSVLQEKFFAVAFEKNQYRKPVIGYGNGIPYLDIYKTQEFFKRNYSPNRMVIAVVGDINFSETIAILKKYFSKLPKGTERRELTAQETLENGEKRVETYFPSGGGLLMGWKKPPPPNRDDVRFDILSGILTGGTSARLVERLVFKEKLCVSVNATNGYPGERYDNLFLIFFKTVKKADPKKIESIVWEEIEKIQKAPPSLEELKRVQNARLVEFLRSADSNGNLADSLTYYELLFGNWRQIFEYYDELLKVTPEEVSKIANQYLSKKTVTIGTLYDSREEKPQ